MNKTIDKDISSAEMTAYWRTLEPEISLDTYSQLMATEPGKQKALQYQQQQYPLAGRHFSLRAGYFYQQTIDLLLKTNPNYDGIISLGSGFSLLTYVIANNYHKMKPNAELTIIDSDIEKIIHARDQHYSEIALPAINNINFKTAILDVINFYQTKSSLLKLIDGNIKNPIFILEGVAYFLPFQSLQYLFNNIKQSYSHAAIIWDYWPDDLIQRSQFFQTVLAYFQQSLPENVNSLISPQELKQLIAGFTYQETELQTIERQHFSEPDQLRLTNEHSHIPARVGTFWK